MVLAWWWMLPVWLLLIFSIFMFWRRRVQRTGKKPASNVRLVANVSRLTNLPEYKTARLKYRRLSYLLLAIVTVTTLSGVLLTARPSSETLITPAQTNRDIVLCLDVSGSMVSADYKILSTFEKLVADFKGQRIGMAVFNSSAATVFPLTDDYELVDEHIKKAKSLFFKMAENEKKGKGVFYQASDDFYKRHEEIIGGANISIAPHDASSQAGTGLASCINRLGDNPTKRSQSIVLATDNELGGGPDDAVILTPQAMMMAKKRNIRVYAIDPGIDGADADAIKAGKDTYRLEHAELKNYSIATGGNYYLLSQSSITDDIIEQISKQEARLFVGKSQIAVSDTPLFTFLLFAFTTTLLILLVWRLKL